MNRRRFLEGLAISASGLGAAQTATTQSTQTTVCPADFKGDQTINTEEYAFLTEFSLGPRRWKVYEDLRTLDGPLCFVSCDGQKRIFPKTAEPLWQSTAPYLGLTLKDIAGNAPDLLAQRVLEKGGDPDPELVKSALPPIVWGVRDWSNSSFWPGGTFLSTVESLETIPLFKDGSTATFLTKQYIPNIDALVEKDRMFDGLVGGWLPVIRKVFPLSDGEYWEVLGFPDVERRERFIVHTWHRVARISEGKMVEVHYSRSYRPFPPRRRAPQPQEFYRALLVSAEYWESHLHGLISMSLPQSDWVDMSKYAFVRELMTRPGGVYPKYGAPDRPYEGSEIDGFQDTFTSAVYTNLEWGRFETARSFIDNYYAGFVEPDGLIDMRGPEMGQYGLMLSLMAKYADYTGDSATLLRHHAKIDAVASLLAELQDESLRLPADDPGHGLIHGWSESDSCLMTDPTRHWKPYYGNSALASRGFQDLGRVWLSLAGAAPKLDLRKRARQYLERARTLRQSLIASIEKNTRRDMNPPYIGAIPGMTETFREEHARDHEGPQRYSHRSYMDLLLADVMTPHLTNLVIDCMRAHGGTTIGVPLDPDLVGGDRHLLSFITYSYAQALLRVDRIEEFLLFLYAHRYHCHRRGHWTAAELSCVSRSPTNIVAPYCTPAQQTIPLLIRWMLVLEDSEADRLYFARGVPRSWMASGREIGVRQAPTRWGRVDFQMKANPQESRVDAHVELARLRAPKEFQVTFRLPEQRMIRSATVNGRPQSVPGPRPDALVIQTGNERKFEIVVRHN